MPGRFEPKLITVLREGYSRARFLQELTAGVIVGIVALPLAVDATGLFDRIGEENACGSPEEALGRARELTAVKP